VCVRACAQVLAATPFNLEGPRIAGFAWINASGARLPVFTETVALRCKLYPESCKNCLTALPDPREPNVTGLVSMEACEGNQAGQRWFPGTVVAGQRQWQQQWQSDDSPACPPSGNMTLMANTSLPGLGQRSQYLSCRADGQPGHACQPGDDVDVWFYAGVKATNQQWALHPCPTVAVGTGAGGGGGGDASAGAGAAAAASLLVSALSGACAGSGGRMVGCDCTDRTALWEVTVTATAAAAAAVGSAADSGGRGECALMIVNRQ
jgi:hypothetical protein